MVENILLILNMENVKIETCDICGKQFSGIYAKSSLRRHSRRQHEVWVRQVLESMSKAKPEPASVAASAYVPEVEEISVPEEGPTAEAVLDDVEWKRLLDSIPDVELGAVARGDESPIRLDEI